MLRNSQTLILYGLLLTFVGCHPLTLETRDRRPLNNKLPTNIEMEQATRLPQTKRDGEEIPLALKALPRDHFNVDWVRAVKEGYINPRGSIDKKAEEEDPPFDLTVVFIVMDPLLRDVVFSHTVHTYWLNCESCHPTIFIPRRAKNYFTMQDIWDGSYCGRCHGKVAFPTGVDTGANFNSNCIKCHYRKKR